MTINETLYGRDDIFLCEVLYFYQDEMVWCQELGPSHFVWIRKFFTYIYPVHVDFNTENLR